MSIHLVSRGQALAPLATVAILLALAAFSAGCGRGAKEQPGEAVVGRFAWTSYPLRPLF